MPDICQLFKLLLKPRINLYLIHRKILRYPQILSKTGDQVLMEWVYGLHRGEWAQAVAHAADPAAAGRAWIAANFMTLAAECENRFRAHPPNGPSLVSDRVKEVVDEGFLLMMAGVAVDPLDPFPFGPDGPQVAVGGPPTAYPHQHEAQPATVLRGSAMVPRETQTPVIPPISDQTATRGFVLIPDPTRPSGFRRHPDPSHFPGHGHQHDSPVASSSRAR